MISQLRIYTVNKGQMDSWLTVFKEELIPLLKKHGIDIEGTWVDAARERFVWIRAFENQADLEAKEAAFYGSAEWKAKADRVRGYLARREVTLIEPV